MKEIKEFGIYLPARSKSQVKKLMKQSENSMDLYEKSICWMCGRKNKTKLSYLKPIWKDGNLITQLWPLPDLRVKYFDIELVESGVDGKMQIPLCNICLSITIFQGKGLFEP